MPVKPTIYLALVDDHKLFREGITSLIEMVCNHCSILFEAGNGIELQKKLHTDHQPDIILMDITMPGMDGYASMEWLHENFPLIKVLVVTMVEQEESVVRMLRLGASGYLAKDVEPAELKEALSSIMTKGYYYSNFINGKSVRSILNK